MFYHCLPLTAVTETGEHCTFFCTCSITVNTMQHIYCIYVVIFKFCKCSFKFCFRAWLRQTVATSLLNRDALNFKAESIISAKTFRERKNRGTPYQTLFCSKKDPSLPPAISCESYLSSGGPLTAMTGMMIWRVFMTKLHTTSIVVLHVSKLLSVQRKISEQS